MIPCGLSSSLPFQRRAKACFCDARSIFMSPPDGSGTAAVPDGTKAVTAYLRAGSNAQALRGAAPVSDHKHRHRISVRTDSRRSSCGCRGELTEVGLNGMFSAGRAFFVRRCAPRSRYPAPGEILLVGEGRCAQLYLVYRKHSSRCQAAEFYQLALRTPGIWPLYASSRKQIRQMP